MSFNFGSNSTPFHAFNFPATASQDASQADAPREPDPTPSEALSPSQQLRNLSISKSSNSPRAPVGSHASNSTPHQRPSTNATEQRPTTSFESPAMSTSFMRTQARDSSADSSTSSAPSGSQRTASPSTAARRPVVMPTSSKEGSHRNNLHADAESSSSQNQGNAPDSTYNTPHPEPNDIPEELVSIQNSDFQENSDLQETTPAPPGAWVSDEDSDVENYFDSDEYSADPDDSNITPQEALPLAPIYDERLNTGLRDLKTQLECIADELGTSVLANDTNSTLYKLRSDAETMSEFWYPERRIVGFIGDSGVGKSSLINCLLDRVDLARSSGDGSACTCVVTEFRNVDSDHPVPFTLEADFMSSAERDELLHELLRSFRLHYTSATQDVASSQEYERIKAAAQRARETLQSIFRNRPEMEDDDLLSFLSNEEEGVEETIRAQLVQWTNTELAKRPGGLSAHQLTRPARTSEECREILDSLTTNTPDDGKPVLWPFINTIRVYLDSPILETGLVLADLPGFRDLNFARVRATERYMAHHCDEVFIVVPSKRCQTDESIPDIIKRCRPDQHKRIVCTQSEDVHPEEEAHGRTQHARNIRQKNERREVLKKQILELNMQFRKSRSREQGSIAVKLLKLKSQEKELELEAKTTLMNRRNDNNQRILAGKYNNIQVFSVSNTLYREYRYNQEEGAEAYIDLSGIPGLRRYCQLVPAEAGLRAVSGFLNHQVPAFLGSVRQWRLAGSDSVTSESANTLRYALESVVKDLHDELISQKLLNLREVELELLELDIRKKSRIRHFEEASDRCFSQNIISTIRNAERAWKREWIEVSTKWSTYHHASYAAFCRKNGNHAVKNGPLECWNDQLAERPREDLAPRFETMIHNLIMRRETLKDSIEAVLDKSHEALYPCVSLAPQAMQNFLENMENRQNCIMECVEAFVRDIEFNIRTMEYDMLGSHDSSYTGDMMREAYANSSQIRGSGSDSAKKALIKDHLSKHSSFESYLRRAKGEYDNGVKARLVCLQKTIDKEVTQILRDSKDIVRPEHQATEADRSPEVAQALDSRLSIALGLLTTAQSVLQQVSSS